MTEILKSPSRNKVILIFTSADSAESTELGSDLDKIKKTIFSSQLSPEQKL